MEIISQRIGITALLLLLVLLLAPPPSAAVRGLRDEEVYEIDYRGPETHSYLPPPAGDHRHHHLRRQKHKSNDLRFVSNGRKEKGIIHG